MGAENPVRRSATAREVAEQMGCSPRTIQRIAAEPREAYLARAAARREHVMALRGEGKKYPEIAEALGIPLSTVKSIMRQVKLRQGT